MVTRVVISALGLLLATGCAATTVRQELPPDHPANPAAATAAPPERSTTLSVAAADPLPPRGGDGGGGSASPSHGEMQHGGGHAEHTSTAPSAGSPTAAPQAGQTLYMCPMHPDVTSTNPDDRCPKCKMKINKPVKTQAPAPATQAAPGASSGHEGHGGQH